MRRLTNTPETVIGDEFVLERVDGGGFRLYAPGPKGNHLVGEYADGQSTWQVIDAIDLQQELAAAA